MPKPRKAQRSDRGGKAPLLRLDEDGLADLARIAGVTVPERRAALKVAIEKDAGHFLQMARNEEAAPSPAGETAILRELSRDCLDLSTKLKALHSDVRTWLFLRMTEEGEYAMSLSRGEAPEEHQPDAFESIQEPLAELRLDIEYALPRIEGRESRGKRPCYARDIYAGHFAGIFRRFFDASKAKLGARRGTPRNFKLECGLYFIHEAFRALYPPEYHPSEKWLRGSKRVRKAILEGDR